MTTPGYSIVGYQPEFKEMVLDLMIPLWGSDKKLNRNYFKWKYEENPYADRLPGIVTIHRGRVVGFRGYFPQKLRIPRLENDTHLFLPGDTCVDPEHRRKGLSVAMGDLATKAYAHPNALFLNASSGRSSFPGYMKLGFKPLASKTFLMRYNLLGLLKCALNQWAMHLQPISKNRQSRSGNVVVEDKPRVEEMSILAAGAQEEKGRIALIRDSEFYRWRFNNPRNRYVYHYALDNQRVSGFVVMGSLPGNPRVYTLDFAFKGPEHLQNILKSMTTIGRYDILVVNQFALDQTMLPLFRHHGFKKGRLLRKWDEHHSGKHSLLIRPVKETYTDKDFIKGALDLRDISNWSLKPICSDYA